MASVRRPRAQMLRMWANKGKERAWEFDETPTLFNISAGFPPDPVLGDCYIHPRMLLSDLNGDGAKDLVIASCMGKIGTGA
jgi:hypothetical protein